MSGETGSSHSPRPWTPAAEMLAQHLERHIEGFRGPLRLERFPGGQSNPTFKLTTPTDRYVIRCKPAPRSQLLPSAHAIEREFRIQRALSGSEVPVPRVRYLCEDEQVVGREFYVMDFIEGRIFWDQALPGLPQPLRGAIYDEMNRVIAMLHRIDYVALGLADFGKPGNYFARQIARWSQQYRACETETIEPMERLIEWLPAHIPQETQPLTALVHGDFRLDNLIFDPAEPRVVAVIDWELATLGHPLADFGCHAASWRIPHDQFRGIANLELQQLGIPDEDEYWARYARRTGLRLPERRSFHLAYGLFRSAAILQGIAWRERAGIASSAEAAAVARAARPLAELGWKIARTDGREPADGKRESA